MSMVDKTSSSSKSRVAALDVLRGIAVLSVLVAHAPLDASSVPRSVILALDGAAYFFSGVELFFVLSGFLVSGLLFREQQRHGSIDAWQFLVRRGLKIYPSFYVFLAVSITVSWVFGIWPHPTAAVVASEALFVQNYAYPLWSHTWSLAVEEHFYLCLVALLAYLVNTAGGRSLARIPLVVAWVCIACLTMRLLTAWLVPAFSFQIHLAPSHLRFDSLSFGMLLSYWYHRRPETLAARVGNCGAYLTALALVLLAICATVPRRTFIGHTVLQSMQYVGHGALLLLVVMHPGWQWMHESLPGRLLQGIGRYSYSIYLWHMGILIWSRALIAHMVGDAAAYADLKLAVYAALAIPVGILVAHLVEMPILLIRDRLFPSRSDALPSLAADIGGEPCPRPVPR